MADLSIDDDDTGVLVKITSDSWELNVRGSVEEFLRLAEIRSADWNSRRSIRAGLSAGFAVWWSFDGSTAWAFVGRDDDVWDIGIAIELATVDELLAGIRAHRDS
jgi:hypothetical protein